MRVTCTRYIGTIQIFVMLNAIADAPAARSAIAQANAALGDSQTDIYLDGLQDIAGPPRSQRST